jgi:hypothetical protein
MKQILAKEDVERAMADLSARGRKTTLAALATPIGQENHDTGN